MAGLKPPKLLDSRFAANKRHYIFQATMAAVVLGAVLAMADNLSDAAVVTGIASSAFIIFMSPHSQMAHPRRVFGGHLLGAIIGLAMGALLHGLLRQPHVTNTIVDAGAAIGVGLGMLAMSVTETEHPPAAGTILGLAMGAKPVETGALVLAMATSLCLARLLLKNRMIDLIGEPGSSD
jgi:CBS-domain-containing membrane protein